MWGEKGKRKKEGRKRKGGRKQVIVTDLRLKVWRVFWCTQNQSLPALPPSCPAPRTLQRAHTWALEQRERLNASLLEVGKTKQPMKQIYLMETSKRHDSFFHSVYFATIPCTFFFFFKGNLGSLKPGIPGLLCEALQSFSRSLGESPLQWFLMSGPRQALHPAQAHVLTACLLKCCFLRSWST